MRYALSGDLGQENRQYFDVLIIGAGIAGLYTALNIDRRYSCCILTKEGVEISNSWLAQGGIAAVLSAGDSFESHIVDTIAAGAGLCHERAVEVSVNEGPARIKMLRDIGARFDQVVGAKDCSSAKEELSSRTPSLLS